MKLGTAERTVAELGTECKQLKQHLEFQEAEMATLKQAAAKQLDELVRLYHDLGLPRARPPRCAGCSSPDAPQPCGAARRGGPVVAGPAACKAML